MRAPFHVLNEIIKPGKIEQIHISLARLPTRTHIEIPITISHAKECGPTLLLLGGMHGDEINGVEIVRRIIVNKHHRISHGNTNLHTDFKCIWLPEFLKTGTRRQRC
jgi:succinylglutamate desuccinylase